MLDDLSKVPQRVRLKMYIDKNKIMSTTHVAPTPIETHSTLEADDDYVYLVQTIQLAKSNFEKEDNHRFGYIITQRSKRAEYQ